MFDVRQKKISRRDLLGRSYLGLGGLALMERMSAESARAAVAGSENPLRTKMQQLQANAKRCIFPFMEFGVGQMDTFEYKLAREKYAGQQMPRDRHSGRDRDIFRCA